MSEPVSERTIGVIVGSNSSTSINRRLARAITALAPEGVTLVDIPITDLGFYSIDLDADALQAAVDFKRAIDAVDGVIIVTPEYSRSIPGVLKNALDQAYKEWNHKPMAAMGYGGVGAARAIEHLRGIGIELQMVPIRNAVHLGGGEFFKVSPLGQNGDMAEVDALLQPSLNATLDELAWWTNATKAAREKTA